MVILAALIMPGGICSSHPPVKGRSAPNTITGCIGIISGWLYDDGIKEKLGFITDHVKKGEFADLGYGVTIKLLNNPLLDRKFKEKEEEIIETMLTKSYEKFVREMANTSNSLKNTLVNPCLCYRWISWIKVFLNSRI